MIAGFGAALVCAAACSESSDDDNSSGGSSASDPRFGTSPCAQCVTTACATERSVCLSEPSCATYLACVEDCELADSGNVEPNCERACPDPTDPAGSEAQYDLSECRLNGAGAECTECGIGSSSDHPLLNQTCDPEPSNDPCFQCLGGNCCQSIGSCQFSAQCPDLNDCASSCPETEASCYEQCYAEHETGVDAYLAMTACATYFCYEPCVGQAGDPCVMCGATKCTNSWLTCELDYSCQLYQLCYVGCPFDDAECFDGCLQSATPEAIAAHDAHKLCLDHACAAECAELLD
ncbi:MAG: hypothetical protein JRI23_03825 [Deltaproteobacteria bacterium]|nr:hypothetical protein [Deltaproteobacteria bacterium]MBW2530657.1 hypothetical protein [Deltaproteobacteria bacterium]